MNGVTVVVAPRARLRQQVIYHIDSIVSDVKSGTALQQWPYEGGIVDGWSASARDGRATAG